MSLKLQVLAVCKIVFLIVKSIGKTLAEAFASKSRRAYFAD